MKLNKFFLLFVISILSCTSCSNETNLIKIFVSSYKEVDINNFKNVLKSSEYNLEISYSSPGTYYYPFQYSAAREKYYDIFILRDDEFLPSRINEIYISLDDEALKLIHEFDYSFYIENEQRYAIKLNDKDYRVNHLFSMQEGHDYYLGIAKLSKNCGKYSSFSNVTSTLTFTVLNNLLMEYE